MRLLVSKTMAEKDGLQRDGIAEKGNAVAASSRQEGEHMLAGTSSYIL